jgi:hypothetical protein
MTGTSFLERLKMTQRRREHVEIIPSIGANCASNAERYPLAGADRDAGGRRS